MGFVDSTMRFGLLFFWIWRDGGRCWVECRARSQESQVSSEDQEGVRHEFSISWEEDYTVSRMVSYRDG